MSNFGGPNSKFEKNFDKRFSKISDQLKKISNNIKNIYYKAIFTQTSSNTYWNGIRRLIDIEYAKIGQVFKGWAKNEIPAVFRRSIYDMNKKVKTVAAKIEATAEKTATTLRKTQASRQLMDALYKDAVGSMNSAIATGRNNMHRITRQTQQTLIQEGSIDLQIADSYTENLDLRAAVKTLAGNLASSMLEGQQFVQAGRYKYTAQYYAEMVGRVKFHEAQSYAARMTAANYNTDLIQISSHNTTTPLCQDYEGKIFSISGKDNRFPFLDQSPPFHPNCLHEFPVFEEALKLEGSYDSFSAFSKGKIDRPPYPSGYTPIKQRTLNPKAGKLLTKEKAIKKNIAKSLAMANEAQL